MSSKVRASTADDPEHREIVIDKESGRRYLKGKFLGKGGFARCYELTDMVTKAVYAGKIVPKSLLVKPHQKEKMSMEIAVHRSLNNAHVVGFHGYFEDSENVYVILEICRRRSMMELHKRRRALTEPEVRFYMHQILKGCMYLHNCNVIHRDLKLGNLFLNDDLFVKIGDFGLATKIDFDGERKRTMCGTPNYIAPEVLAKKGHSYEVDIWSIGCIMYTLLVGKPPFETKSLKETYSKIRKNDYFIPPKVSTAAQMLIVRLLRAEPSERPSPEQALADEFFTSGYMPPRLPTSCLTTAPRFTSIEQKVGLHRKPLSLLNKGDMVGEGTKKANTELTKSKPVGVIGLGGSSRTPGVRMGDEASPLNEPLDCYLHDLHSQLTSCLATSPEDKPGGQHDDAEDPASQPVYWVSKWVDYSDKYGMGYQLCDNSVGVLFNDSTRIVLAMDGENMQYIDRDSHEEFHLLHSYPESLTKKVTLLKYFRNYMSEHLLKTGAGMGPRDGDEIARLPHLRTWFRTRSAIVLHLSIGILQLNFFKDHTKIILCPRMGAVSYIDEAAQFRTYRLSDIERVGCSRDLATRLEYARSMVERLMTGGSGKPGGRERTE